MSRIIHFSNRVEVPQVGKATAGGLDEVIAYSPEGVETVRIGWSGNTCETLEQVEDSITTTRRGNISYITFDIPKNLFDPYYNQLINGFLWPLFHHRADIAKEGFSPESLKGYIKVNELFAKIGARYLKEGDEIIVHDKHLLLLGHHLKEKNVNLPMGFFFHTPCPSAGLLEDTRDFEQQRLVRYLLSHLFDFDMVGCQSRHDLMGLKSIMVDYDLDDAPPNYEAETWTNKKGKKTQFGAFPVAGNNALYEQQSREWVNHKETTAFIKNFFPSGEIEALGVDRLDYTKGLVPRAQAVGRWLHEQGKGNDLKYLQIAPFGRDAVLAYQLERAKVETAFEGLTQQFGSQVKLYMDKGRREIILGMTRRLGTNDSPGIILITPLRDGFNLVATETMVAKDPSNPAVTILSKYAGAAGVLEKSCLLVDPTNVADIAEKIGRARMMGLEERQEMHGIGMQVLEGHTSQKWLEKMREAIKNAQPA